MYQLLRLVVDSLGEWVLCSTCVARSPQINSLQNHSRLTQAIQSRLHLHALHALSLCDELETLGLPSVLHR